MNDEEVREYLIDFQKKELPLLVKRELKIGKTKMIKSVIGPRRAGKTYFMYQKIEELISFGINKESILYLNFEDPRLIDISFKEIRKIVKLHWQIYPISTKQRLYVFIDEPQNIKNWEIAVRALYDDGFDIFITGSSSKLLSKEIATSLRGRTISYFLFPFSFREFLRFKGIFEINQLSSKEKSIILSLLYEFLEFGGFPEVISEKNVENKMKITREYFNLVVYQDIVERYGIKNVLLIKWLIKSLVNSFSKEFSIHKLYNILKSKGIRLSKNTLYSYISMLEDCLFAFFLPRFHHSIRKRELSINKFYLCDVGFTNLTKTTEDIGRKMENVVYLELKKSDDKEIFYWKSSQQDEVDFVIVEGKKTQLIQVCYKVDEIDVKRRETRALIKASKELKCRNLLVITWDYEGEEKHKGKKIKFIPLWKWLLLSGNCYKGIDY